MANPVDVTNRALAEVGTRSQLTGTTIDPTQGAEALYASLLYAPLRDFLLREGDYDWSAKSAVPGASLPATFPWLLMYDYPSDCLRVRQLIPFDTSQSPRPVIWNIMLASGARKILVLEQIGSIIYTIAPPEDFWDSIFTESFVRLLGSGLAFALENRIEASQVKLQEAISFAGIANLRDS